MSYTYQGSRSFSAAGNYTPWPGYYDVTNWVDLGPGSHTAYQVSTPTVSRIEQNNSLVTFGPGPYNWNTGSDTRASGGSYAITQAAGSTAVLTFTGTGINIIGILDSCGAP